MRSGAKWCILHPEKVKKMKVYIIRENVAKVNSLSQIVQSVVNLAFKVISCLTSLKVLPYAQRSHHIASTTLIEVK